MCDSHLGQMSLRSLTLPDIVTWSQQCKEVTTAVLLLTGRTAVSLTVAVLTHSSTNEVYISIKCGT